MTANPKDATVRARNNRLAGEGFYKWLAGIVDSDGYVGFWPEKCKNGQGYYLLRLSISIGSASVIDKDHRMLELIKKTTGAGHICEDKRVINGSVFKSWKVLKTSDIHRIVPRLIKHLVIKGTYVKYVYDKFCELYGQHLSEENVAALKEEATRQRHSSSSVKNISRPSWAWIAGYLDGDGCYYTQYRKDRPNPTMTIQVVAHKNDRVGVDLLQKALGGKINNHLQNCVRWRRSIGFESSSFAQRVLPKIRRYSVLKKHKIEQLLNLHSQRLNEFPSTEEVIVQ